MNHQAQWGNMGFLAHTIETAATADEVAALRAQVASLADELLRAHQLVAQLSEAQARLEGAVVGPPKPLIGPR